MFPCDDALLPDQLDLQQLQRVVILDSKWCGITVHLPENHAGHAQTPLAAPAMAGMLQQLLQRAFLLPEPCRFSCMCVLLSFGIQTKQWAL
jgi:hypothetical protein